ncbi:MAG: hypothetical protein U0746_22745 [Gemmataceae bacterium]
MRSVRLVLAAAVLATAGCGGSPGVKTYIVSGTVNFAGKPVPAGHIVFDPDASKGTAGTQGVANIINGRYSTAASGKGVRAGSYHIRIMGFDGKGGDDLPMGKALFPEYEAKKDLPDHDSELNFDIPPLKR